MNAKLIRVCLYGLDDPGADLTMIGQCEVCGAELWRRVYRQDEYTQLSEAALIRRIQADVRWDRDTYLNHECVAH